MKNKLKLVVRGVISAYHTEWYLEQVRHHFCAKISISSGGNLARIANAQTYGRIIGRWYEGEIRLEPERRQHLGVYTERECPFEIVLRSTRRNEIRLNSLLSAFPRPLGGYFN